MKWTKNKIDLGMRLLTNRFGNIVVNGDTLSFDREDSDYAVWIHRTFEPLGFATKGEEGSVVRS